MYCSAPFTRFLVTVSGDVYLCYGSHWIAGATGNLLASDPMDIWRGANAARLRDSIVDQSFRYCTDCRCPELIEVRMPPEHVATDWIGHLALCYDPTCNIACPSCRTVNKKADETTARIHQVLLSSGILKHVKVISTSGAGEPLASTYFWDLITRLPELGCLPDIGVILTTNGLLLTPKTLAKVLDTGVKLLGIEISVDAATKETYAINRGGNWDRLLDNLLHLQGSGIPLRLNFVVQENNFKEIPQFAHLAFSFGVSTVRFDALNNWGSYERQEYQRRAIHKKDHPRHEELKVVLQHSILRDSRVELAQLSDEFMNLGSPLATIHKISTRSQVKNLTRGVK